MMHYRDMARLIHGVVREYNILHEIPGDNFEWDDVDLEYRRSIENAIKNELDSPAKEPSDSHNRWLKARLDDGWTYGPVKSQKHKTHPCMIPYEDLPRAQQFKDELFSCMVALLKHSPGRMENDNAT